MPIGKPAAHYLSPSFKGRRVVTVDLHDPAFEAVFTYAEQTGPDRPVQDAIRELLLMAVSPEVVGGATRAAQIAAYREARRDAFRELQEMFKTLAARCEGSALLAPSEAPMQENVVGAEVACGTVWK